ncbi:MAG TPA: glycosyltransferase [Chitinophagaceae bacterium]|nr:glycosyltransferase [Chitinophagaceae bacterium]
MRVLWFTTSPSLGASFYNYEEIGRSWIKSLENALKETKDIQMGVAFLYSGKYLKPFKLNETQYFPIKNKQIKGKLNKIYSRWSHKILINENIHDYIKIIEEFSPDIIHIFGTENNYGLLIPKVNIPCIVHIQGNLILCAHKWYCGLNKTDVIRYSKKWKVLKGHGFFHNYIVNKKEAKRELEILQSCHNLMGRTDWDRRLASVFSPKAKYFHCDEIMRTKFYLNEWNPHLVQNKITIITIIRPNIYKGLETVFESQKILRQIFSENQIIWKIAGISKQDEISYLIERKYKKSFEDIGIQLMGPLQEDKLIDEMKASDLFIHPSHIENSPNSVCEAMLLGMPIIATYSGGTPSIIENKKEGLLVQDGDPYTLAGAVIELINDRNYAQSLGANARKKAMVRHNPDKVVSDLINIYSSLIIRK